MLSKRMRHLLAGAALLGVYTFGQAEDGQEGEQRRLIFAGYNKTLLIASRTPPDNERSDLLLNRLRLKLTYRVSSRIEAHVEQDITLRSGSHLGSAAFAKEKNAPERQYWGDGSTFADRRNLHGMQSLFRGYVRWSGERADLTIGRQRIALGTGRMWSALDMLNPANPVQVEREEYVGVDAALAEYKIGALSKLSLIYAPSPVEAGDRWLAQYRSNVKGADLTVSYGDYSGDRLLGLDVATQAGDAGLRAEWVHVVPQSGSSYRKLMLGVDYAFASMLSLSAEAYYSSQAENERAAQFAQQPQRMLVMPLGSRYAGLSASYEFSPRLKASTYILFNLADDSRFFAPSLSYLLEENLSLSGGVQLFSGKPSSEYGRGNSLGYLQLQSFF